MIPQQSSDVSRQGDERNKCRQKGKKSFKETKEVKWNRKLSTGYPIRRRICAVSSRKLLSVAHRIFTAMPAFHMHRWKPRHHRCKQLHIGPQFSNVRKGVMVAAESWLLFSPNPNKGQSSPFHHGTDGCTKPQVFFPETPDKLQLAERLLTKNQGNATPLHHLLPVTLYLHLAPLSLG